MRETQEETGIHIAITGVIGIYTDPDHLVEYGDGEVRQQFSIAFRAEPQGGQLTPSSESVQVAWVHPNRLDALRINPSMRLRIAHGLAEREEPYIG